MPFEIIRNDITKLKVDAIVNAANSSLLGGGGVDGVIHKVAGIELLEECKTLGGCKTGMAKITKGYKLPAKYVIHTVGPIWQGGDKNEEIYLKNCYKNSLELAKEHNLTTVAFPLISSGVYGYPKDKALKVAISEITDFLMENEIMVYLVIFDKGSFIISEKLFESITQYIDDTYVDKHKYHLNRDIKKQRESFLKEYYQDQNLDEFIQENTVCKELSAPASFGSKSLSDVVKNLDETFSQRLLRLIDEKGKSDVEVYKKANIDRKLFSKIRSNKNYKASKITILAFALSLELSLDETKDLLLTSGYAFSHSNKFDIIIEYFIENKIYDIFEINNALFAFEQPLLGA